MAVYDNQGSTINWREQHLYGSSRLGMWKPDINLALASGSSVWNQTGKKFFELSNHLGNVLAVISDSRVLSGSEYLSVIASAQDYYPFGMIQPGRSFGSTNYRYGFNGQEKDDDIFKGLYTARYWEYDSRLARRWNIDPVNKPWQSDYSVLSNSPIWKIDPDGADDIFTSRGKFVKRINNGTNHIMIEQKGRLSRIDNFDASHKWFNSQDDYNRNMMHKVIRHYANKAKVGGTLGVDWENGDESMLGYFSNSINAIYIKLKADGYFKDILTDANNLQSVLEHEKFHKEEGVNHKSTYSSHSKVYVKQAASKTFANTTEEFQGGQVGRLIKYLEAAKAKKEKGWEGLLSEFNRTNKGGFAIKDRESGGVQIFNKDGKELIQKLSAPLKNPN